MLFFLGKCNENCTLKCEMCFPDHVPVQIPSLVLQRNSHTCTSVMCVGSSTVLIFTGLKLSIFTFTVQNCLNLGNFHVDEMFVCEIFVLEIFVYTLQAFNSHSDTCAYYVC